MPLIQFTNIIIDDFSIARREPNKIYTHILTHIHTDHLKGLSDEWNFGPIYCSKITKQLLMQRYPSLNNLHVIELNKPKVLQMAEDLQVNVTFFDANHCSGAVMALIEGYMGRILYTGDIHFDRNKFELYDYLYPQQLRNQQFVNCSKPIDVLYLDNTFLKKNFTFPSRAKALEIAMDFVRNHIQNQPQTRLYISLDKYGKQEVAEQIAKEFGTLIVVSELKYQILEAMDRDLSLFTTNPNQGFIQIIEKKNMRNVLQSNMNSMCLILSGWVNNPKYKFYNRIFCVPYSLHSNFHEIHAFVNSIRPNYIYPIVHTSPDKQKIYYAQNEANFSQQFYDFSQEKRLLQKTSYYFQLQQLRSSYCKKIDGQYQLLMQNIQLQKHIMQKLKGKQIELTDYRLQMDIKAHRTIDRQRYTFIDRDQSEITSVKRKIIEKKRKTQIYRHFKHSQIIIDSDDSDCYEDYSVNNRQNIKNKSHYIMDIDNNVIDIEESLVFIPVDLSKIDMNKVHQIQICKTERSIKSFLQNSKNYSRLRRQLLKKKKNKG